MSTMGRMRGAKHTSTLLKQLGRTISPALDRYTQSASSRFRVQRRCLFGYLGMLTQVSSPIAPEGAGPDQQAFAARESP